MENEQKADAGLPKATDFLELLPNLHGGVLLEKINRALSEVALGVCYSEAVKPVGEVTLKLSLKPIGDSAQVHMTHTLAMSIPTERGKRTETDETESPLHVGRRGRLTAYPERQTDFFDRRSTQPKE